MISIFTAAFVAIISYGKKTFEALVPDPCPTVWEPVLGVKPLRFNPYYVSVSYFPMRVYSLR